MISLLILLHVPGILEILDAMRRNPEGIRFRDLSKVCEAYFGAPRQSSSSHRIYKTPWSGDPRVNIQAHGSEAKAYQVRQVLRAIDRLEREDGTDR